MVWLAPARLRGSIKLEAYPKAASHNPSLSVALNVLGLRIALPEALRRHFLRAVAAAVFFVHVAAVTSAL